MEAKLLKAIRSVRGAVAAADLAAMVGSTARQILPTLNSMEARGLVRKVSVMHRGGKFATFVAWEA